MSDEIILRRTFRVGRFRCEVRMKRVAPGESATVDFVWMPDVPRDLSKKQLRAYQAQRDSILAEFGERMGLGRVAVVEFEGGKPSVHVV